MRRFLQLTPDERWLFVQAFFRLLVIDQDLRWRRSSRVLERRDDVRVEDDRDPTPDQVARAQQYARWIAAAARHHVVQARCLHQSLALHAWLRSDGIASRLHIGVRKVGGEMQAHAWVAVGDRILIDEPRLVATFTPLRGTPSAQSGWLEYRGVH